MKRIITIVLCFLITGISVLPVSAVSVRDDAQYLEDGSYFIMRTDDGIKDEIGMSFFQRLFAFLKKLVEIFSGRKTVSKTGYISYFSKDGDLIWRAYLKADFIYTSKEARCTQSQFTADINDSDWSLGGYECDNSGNTASAVFTMNQTKLFVPLKSITKTMTLTCDTSGRVSLQTE